MKQQHTMAIAAGAASILALGMTLPPQDPSSPKTPNGVALSEFKGYEAWPVMAPSQPEDALKVILGNAAMIKACKDGFPPNGKAVPDGAIMAKIEWSAKANADSPYAVNVPDKLKSVSFMMKDSKRFPETDGWGYAQFMRDATTDAFKPFGSDAAFAKTCHKCHSIVKASDFVYTRYAQR